MRQHWQHWQPGDPVTVNRIVWDQMEIEQTQEVFDNDWFGPGAKVAEFAASISDFAKIPYVQPVNSGSSALTLATEAMMRLGHWQPGDWIIHPLLTFPTSIAPAIRAGLIPCFVDVEMGTYQINVRDIERLVQMYPKHIKGAIIPHLLGNVCDLSRLATALDGRPFIEDCCDTLGSLYQGRHVGNFGAAAAFSFYGSHHITTGGVGGALATRDEGVYAYAKSATHWGRNDYDKMVDTYERFERRYWYDTLGHDFQMTEIQAAFGIAQMGRLKEANRRRRTVFTEIGQYFYENGLNQYFHMPYSAHSGIEPSWFGFPLTIKDSGPFTRRDLATFLIANKIEIRPIFTGNILRHPAFNPLKIVIAGPYLDRADYRSVADQVGENGLFLPAWGMSDGELEYMLGVLTRFFNSIGSKVKCHQ